MRRDSASARKNERRRRERKSGSRKRMFERHEIDERKRVRRYAKRRKAWERRRMQSVKSKYGREAHNACTSKKYYHSEKGAMRALRYMEKTFDKCFTVYKCEFCDGWHLTTHGYGGANEAIRDSREIEVLGDQNQCD